VNATPPEIGSEVTTACGNLVRLETGTPQAIYRGRRVYFCLPICKQDFEADPASSCLQASLAAGEFGE
jgi:YHS domain-containing protein